MPHEHDHILRHEKANIPAHHQTNGVQIPQGELKISPHYKLADKQVQPGGEPGHQQSSHWQVHNKERTGQEG